MKKKTLIAVVTSLSVINIASNLGYGLWNIHFENDKAMIKTDKNATVIIENYLVNNGKEESTPYGRFVDVASAIRSANEKVKNGSSITVHSYLLPGSNAVLENSSLTLLSGVSFFLPYEGKTIFIDDKDIFKEYINFGIADSNKNNVNRYRKNLLTLNNSTLTISNGAAVHIGGEIGTKGVVRNYSEILLDENSKINCSGNLYAYGYIKEKNNINANQEGNLNYYLNECDPKRYLSFSNTGYLMTSLSIADVSSGGTLQTLVDKKICPFTIFDFPNIQTYTKFVDGAKMDAKARISVGSGTLIQYFSEDVHIIDKKGSSALFLTSNAEAIADSFLAFEYCPRQEGITINEATSPTRVYINTNVDIGNMVIKASVVTIDTKEYFLPISYKIKPYVLSKASFSIGNKMKFMPGSEIVVLKEGEMKVDSSAIFYKSGDLDDIQGSSSSYIGKDTAKLLVNGTMKLTQNGKLGAYVETTNTDGSASLDFTAVNSADNFTVVATEGVNSDEVKVISSGPFLNDDGTISDAQFGPSLSVTSDANGKMCWTGDRVSTRKLAIEIDQSVSYQYKVGNYQVYQADDANGTNEIELTSGSTDGNNNYDLQNGKYVKIVVTRAHSASFTNSSYVYNKDTYFKVTSDLTLNIIPNEGVSLSLFTQGTSGAGSTKYKVTEKDTGYSEEVTANGDVILIKGSNFEYKVTAKGTGTTTFDKVYIARGKGGYYSSADDMTPEKYCEQYKLTDMKEISQTYTGIADDNYTIFATRKKLGGSCILPDSLILMANGSYKKAKDVQVGDVAICFNHETGKFDNEVIIINDDLEKEAMEYNVINLYFNDGTSTSIVDEHGFFDLDEKKYVYIHENDYHQYIGHQFIKVADNQEFKIVTLTQVNIEKQFTKICSPVTRRHFNIISDGMLSMPGALLGLFNIFDYDLNTLQYDQEKVKQDIEKYGLTSYEDIKEKILYEVYHLIPGEYIGIAIGKEILTWELFDIYMERCNKFIKKWNDYSQKE